ncbi:MAG TPA: serine hydrolase domain-containing protein [Capsulimonadaceae bacterium]|nr:serine hydrolase domain-containing protein [Capsulimonadaceae bacterium]
MPTTVNSLPQTTTVLKRGIENGQHLGAQLYVSHRGRVVADLAVGEVKPGIPLTPDTLMFWMSSGKPLTTLAIAKLWEEDRFDLDDPICRFIPAFVKGGKGPITIRHVLTHTGGFRNAQIGDLQWALSREIVEHICDTPLEAGWTPGRKTAYHPYTGWIILGELVQRVSRQPLNDYIREEICAPLGMHDTWLGMTEEHLADYREQRLGLLLNMEDGFPPLDAADIQVSPFPVEPSGNSYGPIRELGYLYEMLIGRGARNGRRLLSPQTVEALTARHIAGLEDETFHIILDHGLGFFHESGAGTNAKMPRDYSLYSSPRTFGHSGIQSSVGFADPEQDLVVAWACNGMPGDTAHNRRHRAINDSIYQDLGLT